jgi:hypothetical protein
MQNHNKPKGDAKGYLLGLVTKYSLSQQGTRPPAQKRKDVQRLLGDSPTTDFRPLLVETVKEKRHDAHYTNKAEIDDGRDYHADQFIN